MIPLLCDEIAALTEDASLNTITGMECLTTTTNPLTASALFSLLVCLLKGEILVT